MPLKGFGGIWRPLKRPGRARGGGGGQRKKKKQLDIICLFFFFLPSPPALPSLLKASLFPHLLTLFIYSRSRQESSLCLQLNNLAVFGSNVSISRYPVFFYSR